MARLWIFVLVVGSVLYSTYGQNQYHREIKPRRRLQAATRPQRQVLLGGYNVPVNEANAAAVVEDETQQAQAVQSAAQHLSQVYAQPQQQIQYTQVAQNSASNSSPQQTLRYVDQYGNDVHIGGQGQSAPLVVHHQPQSFQPVVRTAVQPQDLLQPVVRTAVQPQDLQPVVQTAVQVAPQAVHFHQTVPHLHHQIFQQVITPQQPIFQEIVQPQPVYHQQVQVQTPVYHQIAAPAPVVHKHLVHAPEPVYHQVAVPAPHVVQETVVHAHAPQPQVQILAHPQHQLIAHPQPQLIAHHEPLPQLISHPQPVVEYQQVVQPLAPVPIIKKLAVPKVAVPVVQKTIVPLQPAVVPVAVEVQPTVNLIKQPVHPKAIFQKQIFALKNPPLRVLTYSDLCTVYPYQRKLSGCVLKKASIPETHHPDFQVVDSTNYPSQSSKTSVQIKSPNPTSNSLVLSTPAQNNIRDKINNNNGNTKLEGQLLPLDQQDEDQPLPLSSQENKDEQDQSEQDNSNEENVNVAESSNKKEQLVKVKKPRKPRTTTTSTTTTTTTTTKKPKTKRRTSSSKRRSQRKRNSTTTSTTEKPFKLA